MRFQSVVALGLFSSVMATPIPAEQTKFDLPTVQSTFNDIQAGIDKMVAGTKAFDGSNKEAIAGLLADSGVVLAAISSGADKVKASPAMTITDAVSILGPVSTLSSKVDEIVQALAAQKDKFVSLSINGVVLDELKKQRAAAEILVKNILANLPLPSLLGIVAGPIAKQVTDKLDAGIKNFS
jgi:hypothetical protein